MLLLLFLLLMLLMLSLLLFSHQDIRTIERETAEQLKRTMRAAEGGYEPGYDVGEDTAMTARYQIFAIKV